SLRLLCRTRPPHVGACANCEAVQQISLENMSEFGFVLPKLTPFVLDYIPIYLIGVPQEIENKSRVVRLWCLQFDLPLPSLHHSDLLALKRHDSSRMQNLRRDSARRA